jgi:glycosyltransferase involved in cell wall biosynthesis
MKVLVIQPVLPQYDIAFFNEVATTAKHLQLVVLADVETKNSLNQVRGAATAFDIVDLPQIERSGLVFRPGLHKAIARIAADVVVFNGNPRDVSQIVAMARLRLSGKRFYVWGMFHRIGGLRTWSKLYYRLAGKLADKCLTYTRVGASVLVNLGVRKEKIFEIGTAIDERIPLAQSQATAAEDVARFRDAQGLQGKRVVLQVVRLSAIKKPELLIEAARILARQRPEVEVVLIGDGEMRAKLERMVADYDIKQHVRFVGALYDEPTLALWYKCADIFVMPTCIGLSAHHAMCYGVPIITDDSLDNQASEFAVLYDGLNALLYQEGSAASLAGRIGEVIDTPSLGQFLSANALHTARSVHTLARKSARFVQILEERAPA